MIHNHFLLLRLLGILACFIPCILGRAAIIGGDKAGVNQFPYQVTLLSRGQDRCGGGIIGDQFILTAAHCILRDNGQFYNERNSIIAGTNDLRKIGQSVVIVEIEQFFLPAEYKPLEGNGPGDIAILKLKHPLGLSDKLHHLKRLELPKNKHEMYVGKTATIAGFGWDWIKIVHGVEIGGNSDTHLRFADVEVISKEHENYNPDGVDEYHIAARFKHQDHTVTRGVCTGDSGSPLVYDGVKVIGILSLSPEGCSEQQYAGVYSRVSEYLDFIHNVMHGKLDKNIRMHTLHP